MSILIMVVVFLTMLLLGFPIIFAIGIASMGYIVLNDIPLAVVTQVTVNYMTEFVLLAIPLFIFAAHLMNESNMTNRIIEFLRTIFGPIRGGLAHINVSSSMIFAGISGAQVADVSSVGTVMAKAMKDEGYDIDYAAAVSAASATVGPIIPPSVPMVVAGAMAGLSVSQLFMGGLVPGLLMGFAMMGVVAWVAKKQNHPKHSKVPLHVIWKTFLNSSLDLFLPIIVIGGIVVGWFTPTEGAGIAVLAALILGFIIKKTLTIKKVIECAYETIIVTADVLLIAAVCILFSWILMYERIPQDLILMVTNMTIHPSLLLLLIIFALLVLGAFIAGMATLLIAVPIVMPLVPVLGMDPYHLIITIVIATMLGAITPPVGTTLFIMSSVTNRPMFGIVKAMVPFLIVNILVLLLVAYNPEISTFLPNLFYRN
jgi:C4-dicarboxylate transporter, DctM subunit